MAKEIENGEIKTVLINNNDIIEQFIIEHYQPRIPNSSGVVLDFFRGSEEYASANLQQRHETAARLKEWLHAFASFVTARKAEIPASEQHALREALNAVLFE